MTTPSSSAGVRCVCVCVCCLPSSCFTEMCRVSRSRFTHRLCTCAHENNTMCSPELWYKHKSSSCFKLSLRTLENVLNIGDRAEQQETGHPWRESVERHSLFLSPKSPRISVSFQVDVFLSASSTRMTTWLFIFMTYLYFCIFLFIQPLQNISGKYPDSNTCLKAALEIW